MRVYESKEVRNAGIVGHGHAGKTSLAAALLFTAGATKRLTRVDEGNTPTDFDEEEIQRKLSISSALAAAEWKKCKINLNSFHIEADCWYGPNEMSIHPPC